MNPKISDKQETKHNWFYDIFLNNQVVIALLIVLLLLLIILVFSKVAYLFTPFSAFFDMVGFPLVFSGVLFYLLSPIKERLVRYGVNRHMAIWLIFIGVIILIAWGISSLYPVFITQSREFVRYFPSYIDSLSGILTDLPIVKNSEDINTMLNNAISSIDVTSISNQASRLLNSTFGGLGNVVGTVTQFVMGLLTVPIVLYYFLLDGHKLGNNILYVIPTKHKNLFRRMFFQMNFQVAQYIRGQIIVAICVGLMFSFGYSFIGLNFAIALGVLSGFLNIIPFLGSFIAVIPALIVGLITSPTMLLKVIVVLMIEQTIEGRFISPQVLGNSLKVHPVTILFVLLTAGKIFGVTGVIIGIPGYAVLRVIVTEFYELYRENSTLYDEEDEPRVLASQEFIETHRSE